VLSRISAGVGKLRSINFPSWRFQMTNLSGLTSQRRFDISIGISAFVSTALLAIIAFAVFGDAAERAQFVVAGCEGVTLALALAVAGRALQGPARRAITMTSRVTAAVVAA
jgi:hypothetical protein